MNQEIQTSPGTLQSAQCQNFRKVIESILDPVIMVDRQQRVTFWNHAAEMMFGYTTDEALGKLICKLIVPENIVQEQQHIYNRVFEKLQDISHYETRRHSRDGRINEVQVNFFPLVDELGEVSEVCSVYRDNKEHHALVELSRKQQKDSEYHHAMMSLLLENTSSNMLLLQPIRDREGLLCDFTLLYTNSSIIKSTEWLDNQYTFLETYPELKDSELLSEYFRVMETGNDWRGEYHVNFQGLDVWSQVYSKKVGENLLVTYSDITELKKAGQKITEQNRLIMGVTETVPDLISVISLPSRDILYLNRDPFLLNGFDGEKLKNKNTEERMDLVHSEDVPVLDLYFNSLMRMHSDDVAVAEYRARNDEGEWCWFRARGRVFERDPSGTVISCVNVIQNITAQKRSDVEIKKNLTLLKQAEEIAEIGSWEYNMVSKKLTWSQGMYQLCDIPQDREVCAEVYLEIAAEGQQEIAEQIIRHLNHGTEPFRYEMRIRTRRGERVQHVKGVLITGESGLPEKMLGIHVDITEQVNTEKALREQMQITGMITGASPDLIFIFDVNSLEIRYYTRTVADEVGYSKEQIAGMKNVMMDVIHPDDHEVIHNCVRRVKKAADGEVVETEYRVIDPGGNIRWFRDRNTVFKRNDKGEVLEKIVFSHEITDQKLAENELRTSRERFDTAINLAPMVLSILTSIRDTKGQIVDFGYEFISKSGNDMAGKNLTGSSMLSEFPEMSSTAVFAAFIQTVETGIPCDVSNQFNPEGNGTWVRWRAVKFLDGLFVSVEDITDKKRMESQVIENKLLQQKEILNAIILAQEQERERIGEALHNGVAQLLYVIQTRLQLLSSASDTESKNIRDILSIVSEAINDTRQISFELVPAVLKDYGIEVALKALVQKISRPLLQIDVQLDLKQRLPEKTEFALYRIVQELMNNILKHASASSALVELSLKRKYILLEVSDNGCGFDKNDIRKLTKGIGLQSVRNRVNLLEGELRITSAPGKGTRIQIKLPA